MEDIPFVLPVANTVTIFAFLVYWFRTVIKGTWMHVNTHNAILDQYKERLAESKAGEAWWRAQAFEMGKVGEELATTAQTALKANGEP